MGRVLVVDDEPSMREFLAICLRRAGHEVELADSGQVAIDRRVAGLENVQDTLHIGERGPAPSRDRARERFARIVRRAGETAEAGDQ